MSVPPKAWVCPICGYVHEGPEPPEECPLCGAAGALFEPVIEPAADAAGDPAPEPGAGPALRVVIVGAGVAGVSAAEAARQAAPEAEVLLVTGEPGPPIYRLSLTRYLAGELAADALELHPAEWYQAQRITLQHRELTAVTPATRTLRFRDGGELAYDRLVLALGAHPFRPDLPGAGLDRVYTLRTREDAEQMLAVCGPEVPCVCIGGGLLGLETAGALARRGARVTVVEHQRWLLSRQLNRRAGAVFERQVRDLGIALRTGVQTRRLQGGAAVSGVELDTGEVLPARVVVFSAGVRANLELAQAAGLEVGQGIRVDDAMRTSAPDVFAAGDGVEHRGILYGTWPPAMRQGATAGLGAAGQTASFQGLPRSATLKALGVPLFSIGQMAPARAGDRLVEAEAEGGYTGFVWRAGQLIGAILLGDARLAPQAQRLVEAGTLCPPLDTAAEVIRFLDNQA